MNAPPSVPVTVDPQAAARIAELGMQAELEQMLRHMMQTVPGLRRVEVEYAPPYDFDPDDDAVILKATRDHSLYSPDDPVRNHWRTWKLSSFSPDVCRRFALQLVYEEGNGG